MLNSPADDTELLKLGRQFEPLLAAYLEAATRYESDQGSDDETEAEFQRALSDLHPVLMAIGQLHARTSAGMSVKMRAWAHTYSTEGTPLGVPTDGCPLTAMSASIFRDLLAQHGVALRTTAHPSSGASAAFWPMQ